MWTDRQVQSRFILTSDTDKRALACLMRSSSMPTTRCTSTQSPEPCPERTWSSAYPQLPHTQDRVAARSVSRTDRGVTRAADQSTATRACTREALGTTDEPRHARYAAHAPESQSRGVRRLSGSGTPLVHCPLRRAFPPMGHGHPERIGERGRVAPFQRKPLVSVSYSPSSRHRREWRGLPVC